jgi:hypothetical protein
MVMIENSCWFLGDYMFSQMLGPVFDSYANHYTHDFKIQNTLLGLNNKVDFLQFDFRNTKPPLIDKDTIEFFMFGDFIHEKNDCTDLNPSPISFLEGHLSQLSVSASSAECFLQ